MEPKQIAEKTAEIMGYTLKEVITGGSFPKYVDCRAVISNILYFHWKQSISMKLIGDLLGYDYSTISGYLNKLSKRFELQRQIRWVLDQLPGLNGASEVRTLLNENFPDRMKYTSEEMILFGELCKSNVKKIGVVNN